MIWRRKKPKPDYANIRRLELLNGTREPDMTDVRDEMARMYAQVRYECRTADEILADLRAEQQARQAIYA